jgi:predicted amidohydrolase
VSGIFGSRLRLRVEQLAPVLGDPDANVRRIASASAEAAAEGVELVVTPELSLTGYDLRDLVHEVAAPIGDGIPGLPPRPDLVVGLVERGADFVPYNTAVHLRAGGVLHRHRKIYLPTYGMFDEGRYFGRGDRARVYDAGGGWRIGLLVCEDLWHPSLVYLLAMGGASLVIVQAAAGGRGAWDGGSDGGRFASWGAWEHIARAAALAYGIYVVVANRVGVEGSVAFCGGSMIVGPGGEVVARADDLGEDRITADLRIDAVAAARRPYAHARDEDVRLVTRELDRLIEEGG